MHNTNSYYIVVNGQQVPVQDSANQPINECYTDANGQLVSYDNRAFVQPDWQNVQQYYYDGQGNLAPWTGTSVVGQAYVAPRTCTVPLETLVASPYNLLSGEGVWARIVCVNEIGSSMASDIGNDAIIPRPPDSCTNLNLVARNTNSIQFGWTDGLSNGGAPIESYDISYQQVSGTSNAFGQVFTDSIFPNYNQMNNNVRQYTASSLTNGAQYMFNVVTNNVAGSSVPCTITLMACVAPATPVSVSEVLEARTVSQLGISWAQAFNDDAHDVTYTVFISYTDSTGTIRQDSVDGITGNTFNYNTVAGLTYSFSVSAQNVCGASAQTNALVLIAGIEPSVPRNVYTTLDVADRKSVV